MNQADRKKEIRLQALAARDGLSVGERRDYSEAIVKKLTDLPCYLEADAVFTYIAFRSEVDTFPLLERAFADKKAVFVPRVLGREMAFFQISGVGDLVSGYRGILEPEGGSSYTDWVSQADRPDALSVLICMPGAAFDRSRHRIGYGGGFYDKYLERMLHCQDKSTPRITSAALAFSCQVLEEIPWEVHDICPERIITEREIIEKLEGGR